MFSWDCHVILLHILFGSHWYFSLGRMSEGIITHPKKGAQLVRSEINYQHDRRLFWPLDCDERNTQASLSITWSFGQEKDKCKHFASLSWWRGSLIVAAFAIRPTWGFFSFTVCMEVRPQLRCDPSVHKSVFTNLKTYFGFLFPLVSSWLRTDAAKDFASFWVAFPVRRTLDAVDETELPLCFLAMKYFLK